MAILVVFGLIRQARQKTAGGESKKQVVVIDIVDGEHRTASSQELGGLWLKAQGFEWNAERRFRAAGKKLSGRAQKKQGNTEEAVEKMAGASGRDGALGNRHDRARVLVSLRSA